MGDQDKITGGYILLARKIGGSEIMHGPPLHFKLWVWMLIKANWTDNKKNGLKRGQFHTSILEMQDAMSWKIGYRKHMPTKQQIRCAYENHTKHNMINTAKTTRGMIITILNYSKYQLPEKYEQHSEETTKDTVATHYTKEGYKKYKYIYAKNVLLPIDFQITPSMKKYAEGKGFNGDLKDITEGFILYHRKKGTKFKDWHAAWQTWLRNDIKWHPIKTNRALTVADIERLNA